MLRMIVLGGFVAFSALAVRAQPEKQVQQDMAAFRGYLAKHYQGKKWQTGPAAIASKEIKAAYGNKRFYFVFSAPPLPPGAPLKELLDNFRKRMEEFQRDFISVTVSIDDQGKVEPVKDFNKALMAVKSDDDARTAAAAVLSLHHFSRVGPGPIPADLVTITRSDKGWTATVNKKNHFHGNVVFDEKGRVKSVSKQYAGPLPP